MERGHERELSPRGGEGRVLEALQSSLEALGMAIEQPLEVRLLGAYLLQKRQQGGVGAPHARARVAGPAIARVEQAV